MSGANANRGNLRPFSTPGPPGPTGATGPIGPNGLIIVNGVSISHTDLALGGTKVLYTASSPTAKYNVLGIFIVANNSTQWSGGDREITITDNIAAGFGNIASITLQAAATSSYGWIAPANDQYGIQYPNTDPLVSTAAGQNIIAKYFGGTTDYSGGTGSISMILYQNTV